MYTSGCPKNQKRCWYKIGSPPPAGSKKDVLKLRSVNSIGMAPASTGKDKRSRIAVKSTDHTNSGISSIVRASGRMLEIVVIKFAGPRMPESGQRRIYSSASSDPPFHHARY